MPDFPASPKPNYPIEETSAAPEVLISTHRDGSEQRRYKGAGRGTIFRLSFGTSAPITQAESQAIRNHFVTEKTLTAFNWTHPETGTVYLVRYAEPPSFRLVAYNAYEGEVQLQVVPA